MIKNLLAAGAAATLVIGAGAHAQTLGIGTSGPGALTHGVGSAIAKVVSEKSGMQMRVRPSGGSSIYVPAMNAGDLEFALTSHLEARFAYTGKVIYTKAQENVRVVARLRPLAVGFFVQKDSPVQKFSDLKGKRLAYGYTTQKIVGHLIDAHLANHNMTVADIKPVRVPNVLRGADEFSRGRADALFFAVASGKVREVNAKVGGLRLLPLDASPEGMARLRKWVPVAYVHTERPRKGQPGVTQPTPIMGYDLILIANSSVPNKTVGAVMKALAGNKKDLVASFRGLVLFNPKKMTATKGLSALKYHPGAIEFFQATGQWPPKS